MKRLNLNPTGRTVYKISQPGVEAARQKFTIEPMRFLTVEQAKALAKPIPYHDQLPWCPAEFRDEYRRLRRKGLTAAEARPLIEAELSTQSRSSSSVPVSSEPRSKAYNPR
jgi:hypothetical protein